MRVLHNKSIFAIEIVAPTECIELFFSFSNEQRRAKKYHERRVYGLCIQSNFGSLSFKPTKLEEIKQIKMYQKLVHVILFVIARNYLDDMPITMYTICTRAYQLRALLQRLELMQVMTRDNEIIETRLELIVQHVDIVQTARRMCNKLDFLHVQGIKNILERSFDKIFILMPNLIQ
jgi:hypothetical protein